MNMNLIIFDIYEFSDAFWLTNSYPFFYFFAATTRTTSCWVMTKSYSRAPYAEQFNVLWESVVVFEGEILIYTCACLTEPWMK